MNARRDLYASRDFIIVHMDAVEALGSWEAAGCWQRIAYRCEPTGEWTATMQEIADEIRVSLSTAKRITGRLREAGWIESERRDPQVATLTWRVLWSAEGQPDTGGEGQSDTLGLTSESVSLTPGSESVSLTSPEGQPDTVQSANLTLSSVSTEGKKTTKTDSVADAPPTATSTTTRGTRLPADWEPSEDLKEWFRTATLDAQDPQSPLLSTLIRPWPETESFKDYWRARPGQGGVKLDWDATWRNWMRTSAERAASRVRPSNVHTLPSTDADHNRRVGYFTPQEQAR